ncbi:hypothetical protein GIB67_002659 [Kingdonia uniflora]|uniref:Cytochrome P450 n=1 Tax=Kingdonia uniflora TaxID=39325 RepID=A0A7J7LJE5_9MAGN|nr:hypothetical protein GIB67_002659 [Kingdonia uniflora]
MIFYLTTKKMINYDEVKSGQKLWEKFADVIKGLISFPLNIPGTIHYKCLQGRKKAMKLLKDMLAERRVKASPEKGHGYTIPVMVCPHAVHLNPVKYEDPLVFNPWRWEQPGMETSVGSKNFIAFCGGPRYCT